MSEEIKNSENSQCPSPVLFTLAINYVYHSSVDPWYAQIKELSGGATFHNGEFHSAVIFGMFPELKEASQYYRQNVDKYIKENKPTLSKIKIIRDIQKRKFYSGIKKIEMDTIKKYNLPMYYDIYNLSEEQRARIKANLISEENHLANKALALCSPVLQVLGQSLKSDVIHSPSDSDVFAQSMKDIQKRLDDGKENYQDRYSSEENEIVKQIFKMQDMGILDKEFNIKNFSKFKTSYLVCNFPYKDKVYNLEKKIGLSNQNEKINTERTE